MSYKRNAIIERIKKHSSIGMDKHIRIIKKKPSFVKFRKINIEINSFHRDIINKYKSISDVFFYDDFNFLHFTAPEESSIKFDKSVDEKVQEQIQTVLEKVYIEQEKVVVDFRVKELLLQKAKLIEYEKNIVNEKFIKEVLYKELNRFKKSDAAELDERILFYTQVNNYLVESKINHINKYYQFNSKKLIEYNTKDIKSFIQMFKENDVSKEINDIDSLKKIEKTIIKSLSIEETKRVQKSQKKQTSIGQALNISSLFTEHKKDLSVLNNFSFERSIKKSNESLFKSLETQESKDLKVSELIQISKEVISTFDVQMNKLFQVQNNNIDMKTSFEEDIKAVLENPNYSKNRINEELSLIKKVYVNTILTNEEKDLDIKDEKGFEQNLYKQSVIQLSKSKILVNTKNKKVLSDIVKNVIIHKEKFKSANEIINEVLIKFQQSSVAMEVSILYRFAIAACFMFVFGYNQYLWPLIMTTTEQYWTVVMGLKTMYGSISHRFAFVIMSMIPPVLIIIFLQRWFIQGIFQDK